MGETLQTSIAIEELFGLANLLINAVATLFYDFKVNLGSQNLNIMKGKII
jgi:hypothetical protein